MALSTHFQSIPITRRIISRFVALILVRDDHSTTHRQHSHSPSFPVAPGTSPENRDKEQGTTASRGKGSEAPETQRPGLIDQQGRIQEASETWASGSAKPGGPLLGLAGTEAHRVQVRP
jgi:hypothetical protein